MRRRRLQGGPGLLVDTPRSFAASAAPAPGPLRHRRLLLLLLVLCDIGGSCSWSLAKQCIVPSERRGDERPTAKPKPFSSIMLKGCNNSHKHSNCQDCTILIISLLDLQVLQSGLRQVLSIATGYSRNQIIPCDDASSIVVVPPVAT